MKSETPTNPNEKLTSGTGCESAARLAAAHPHGRMPDAGEGESEGEERWKMKLAEQTEPKSKSGATCAERSEAQVSDEAVRAWIGELESDLAYAEGREKEHEAAGRHEEAEHWMLRAKLRRERLEAERNRKHLL